LINGGVFIDYRGVYIGIPYGLEGLYRDFIWIGAYLLKKGHFLTKSIKPMEISTSRDEKGGPWPGLERSVWNVFGDLFGDRFGDVFFCGSVDSKTMPCHIETCYKSTSFSVRH
jgi:hypothetical protein